MPVHCQAVEPQWFIMSVLSTDLGCEHVEIIQDLINFGLALGAMGTSDSPLLSFYVLGQFNSWQCSVWHSSNSWNCTIVCSSK